MDVISHGLWGGLAFGRKNRRAFLWAFSFGIMPDILSFGMLSCMRILGLASGPDWSNGLPKMSDVPDHIHMMYNLTHSLPVFILVFALVLLATRKVFWPMFAWPLHILVDIPTHSTRFFATPFLWPFSDYRFDGVSWAQPYIFYPNLVLLLICFVVFFFSRRHATPKTGGHHD